jgi:hypothetical protein
MTQINTTKTLKLVATIASKYAEEIVSEEIAKAKERIDARKDELLARITVTCGEMLKTDSVSRDIIINIDN